MTSLKSNLSLVLAVFLAPSGLLAERPDPNSRIERRKPKTIGQLVSQVKPQENAPKPVRKRSTVAWTPVAAQIDGDSREPKGLRDFFAEEPAVNSERENEQAKDVDAGSQMAESEDSEASEENKSDMNSAIQFARLTPIQAVSIDPPVTPGILPEDFAAAILDSQPEDFQSLEYARNGQIQSSVSWTAPWVAYNPLYFEDIWLERHGRDYGCLQPILSAANFYGRMPLLPYMKGATPCRECTYSLGLGRAGDCPPHYFTRPKCSARGLLFQAASVTGSVLLTP